MIDNEEHDIKRTKKRAKWGCLIWATTLILGPIVLIVGIFSYQMYFKESVLVTSHSPNNINTIEVVEKGSPAWFGPSSVRIKSGWKHIDRSIGNDGKTLLPTNVSIDWKNDYEAIITLYGEEQAPETIEFKVNEDKKSTSYFTVVQLDLGSFTFKTSESPNLINIIELREVTKSKGPAPHSTVKIYYGERGSILEKYKEYNPNGSYTPEDFQIFWESDNLVTIDIFSVDESGSSQIESTIRIDLSD